MRSFLFLLFVLSSVHQGLAAQNACDLHGLPRSAQEVLARHFRNWKIVTISDLSSDDQKLWSDNYSQKCPGISEGAFGSAKSITLTLIHRNGGKLFQILIVLEPSRDGYSLHTLSRSAETETPDVLLKIPPGTYHDVEGDRSINTTVDSIAYVKLEAAGTLYYKVDGAFRSLEISE